MMIGNLLIYGAVVTSIGSVATLAWAAGRNESLAEYGRYLLFATGALLVGAFGYLSFQFVTTDYTNQYVWNHTADYLPVFYRWTGSYAGINGSLLLWAALVAVFVAWLGRRIPDREHALVVTFAAGTTAAFAVMSMFRTPFEPLAFDAGRLVFGPTGLNPMLVNPYMGIHPPVTFAGYALTVPAFAIGVAHFVQLLRGKPGLFDRWLPRAIGWLRLSWVMLTAAVALGALWSYNTLGWGGLWAWDPVETAVLVSWLVVSATLHAVANYRRRGQNALLAPTLTAVTFPSVVFARLVTQSGTSMLHSFGMGLSKTLLSVMIVSLVLSVGLPLYLWARGDVEGRDLDDRLLSMGNLLFLSVLVIGVLTFVSLWGIAMPIVAERFGKSLNIGVNFYNLWSYPVAIAMLLLLGLYNDYVANGRRALWMLGVAVVATVLAAVVPLEGWKIAPEASGMAYGLLGQANGLVLFPPVAYVFLGVSDRLLTVVPRLQDRDEKIAITGRGLVHVGLALILVAAPFTYLFATSGAGLVPVSGHDHGPMSLGYSGYTVEVDGYESELEPTAASFGPAETEAISAAVESVAVSPAEVGGTTRSNVIVTGEITDVQSASRMVVAELDGSGVWVTLGTGDPSDSLVGKTIWAQGPVNTTEGSTLVESSPMFVGVEPTEAVVPPNRIVHRRAQVTVNERGKAIASGEMRLHDYLVFQSTSDVYVERNLLADVYVAPQQYRQVQGMEAMYVMVKRIPLMNLVRLGIALMLVGGLLIFRYGSGEPENWTK